MSPPLPRTLHGASGSVTGTVLVVEDEETLRLAVSKMLRMKGFSVIEAIDGDAAVDLFRANESDIAVVLLDMTLPESAARRSSGNCGGSGPASK